MTSSLPPDPFDSCPGYHLPDFDPYKSCGNVTNFCSHARDIYNIEMLLRWAIFVIPCCLSFFALFLNIYILYVLVPSLRRMNERSKKKYVFILSRAISSTMSIISIFLLPTMIFLTHFNFWVIALFIIFEMLSFLSLLGGIAGTTLTIYVAVVHPVYYTREMSLRKCVAILFLFWTSAIIVAIGCGIVEAAFMGKTRKHYVFVLSRSLSSILAVFCLLVLEITLFTNEVSPSFTFYAVSFSFYNFSMDSLLLSYIMISLVTYFGVVHSSFYRNRITLKALYFILGAIWVLSLCLAVPLSLYQAASNVPGPIECDQKYCAKVVEWITYEMAA
ncbi:hypothetical protein CAEBREN_03708 [Caenorhabditis brenneri]|uniref:G-protein coupled receptors family 1 profile domain-containing protein n=1 Tax=Caenorhabditis brenneri TaxID=135651 RepID=G0MPF8_CAEBE|nr:hypothetical protein CAEBREN_03708 [Caenorhabditis brenneri]